MNNIKQALERAIEVINKNTHLRDKEAADAINACKAALAELDKCEPVGTAKIMQMGLKEAQRQLSAYEKLTTPPQQQWVGLSDGQIAVAIHESRFQITTNFAHFARAIEAKLKQLNTKG